MTLLDRESPSVARTLESVCIVEERRKDIYTNYPRAFPALYFHSVILSPKFGPFQLPSISISATVGSININTKKPPWSVATNKGCQWDLWYFRINLSNRTRTNVSARLLRSPAGGGSWYDPEDKPKRLTNES
jgi:hypothetical protein